MNDIKRHKKDNIGGINSYKFILIESVYFIPAIYNGAIQTSLEVLNGSRWYDGYATEQTMRFTDEPKESEHGQYYSKKFTCKIPKDRIELIKTLMDLQNKKAILQITYNNGTKKLIGTKQEPLYIKSSFDSKTTFQERQEYELTMEGEGVNLSPFYNV